MTGFFIKFFLKYQCIGILYYNKGTTICMIISYYRYYWSWDFFLRTQSLECILGTNFKKPILRRSKILKKLSLNFTIENATPINRNKKKSQTQASKKGTYIYNKHRHVS